MRREFATHARVGADGILHLDVATEFLDTNVTVKVIVETKGNISETSRPTPDDIEKRLQALTAFTSPLLSETPPLSDYALSRESIYDDEFNTSDFKRYEGITVVSPASIIKDET
ncbi:MAG: hypothetical protein AAFY15_10950 [Cyanobacteria bacterium J06648_11]